MERELEENDFSFNIVEDETYDNDESALEIPSITRTQMSGHSANKHYPFYRRASQSVLDLDSDEDNPPSNNSTHRPLSDVTEAKFDPKTDVILKENAGPSRNPSLRSRSPQPLVKEHLTFSATDSDESDELGVAKKKRSTIPGEYDIAQYEHLEVSEDITEIFQYITKYTPQQLNLDYKFKPFIPEFIPAVGDIDAFLKVVPPEKTLSGEEYNDKETLLGLLVLDEPAANQSDPALLHLQLRAASIGSTPPSESMVVKKVENIEKNSKIVDKWIKDITELHKNKAAITVRFTDPMPELDELMQEWPEEFESALKLFGIPESTFPGTLSQYIEVLCALFDIPVYPNKIQSLHVLFCLYAAVRTSYHYRGAQSSGSKDNVDIETIEKTDRLVLD